MAKIDRIQRNNEINRRYKLVNNALRQIVKNNPKDLVVSEIGDVKQPDTFYPQAKISRWGIDEQNNEVNFSLRYVDNEPGEPVIEYEGKIVKYKKPKVEFHAYDLDPSELGEDGGLEVELQLNEKPDTNKFNFTIQTKELDFFYQPPLTPEEIEQGAERPENVVGSYAVYHKTKGGMNRADGMEYKTGKAFHIYRPKVKDANGVEVWGELNIDEAKRELTVTVPQEFLDSAVYPVVVDPTFGYTSVGGSAANIWKALYTYPFDSPEAGTLQSITGYCSSSLSEQSMGMACYNDTARVDYTNENIGTISLGWITINVVGGATLSAQTYNLGFTGNAPSNVLVCKYDTGALNSVYTANNYSYPPPDPRSVTHFNHFMWSVYATYTAGGGGGAAPATGYITTNTKFW
jgi:hypothetical protein